MAARIRTTRVSGFSLASGSAALALGLALSALAAAPQTTPAPAAQTPPAAAPPGLDPAHAKEAEELRHRIEDLEKQLLELRSRLRQLDPSAFPPPPPVVAPANSVGTVGADQALTSITSFIAFAREAYALEFGGVESGGVPDRKVERWAAQMSREWRKPVRWVIHHGKTQVRGDSIVIRATVVDDTGAPLGDDFDLVLDKKEAKRYSDRIGRNGPAERWNLHGAFIPRFVINPERMTMGAFDSPPFIGPGVELTYDLVIDAFHPGKPAPPAAQQPSVTPSKSPVGDNTTPQNPPIGEQPKDSPIGDKPKAPPQK